VSTGPPHLGASTVEAQLNVAVSVAKQCIEVLRGGAAKYVVNAPMIPPEQAEVLEPYTTLAEKMGRFAIQIVSGRLSSVELIYGGELSSFSGSLKFVTRVALKGLLDPILQQPVNIVNAEFIAKERGISIAETVTQESSGFKNLITLRIRTDKAEETVSGTVFLSLLTAMALIFFEPITAPMPVRPLRVGRTQSKRSTPSMASSKMSSG
jgi:D-3-phosphoglycerate dehydrogenase